MPVAALRGQSKNGELLYFPDDTHWNENGVAIAAGKTWELICALGMDGANVKASDNPR